MNHYEAKQEARRARLFVAATRRREKSSELYEAGTQALSAIPFGQPILVGHHSERGDRSYRSRAVGKMDRSFKLASEADDLERRAASVGDTGISSDDPDAVKKLTTQLESIEAAQRTMVAGNAAARKGGTSKPFMAYQLSNNSANARRTKQRIAQLTAAAVAPDREPIIGNGWSITEDRDDNRIVIRFVERQPEEVTRLLRSRAFLWSHSRKAWVRKITGNARFAADQIAAKLSKLII